MRISHIARSLALAAASVGSGQALAQEPLTGDWYGNRTYLADNGVTFQFDVAQFYQGVTAGGLNQHFKYGGHGDYVTNVDFGKLGVQEGLFLKVRAEHRFGENINGDTGAFLPASVLTALPVADSEELYLTNVLFTQALSERFAVFAGKLDTLDGDLNAFAHGRGKTQFSNVGFVTNPALLRVVPYSTLGCGFAVLGDEGEPVFSYMLLNSEDTAKTSGFSELFNDGVAMAAELRLPTEFYGLPGHQLVGAAWNNREFTSLGQDPRVVLPDIPVAQASDAWAVYWNFDQHLFVDPCDAGRGWGVFGRAAISDEEINPLSWFLSFGLGGHNPMRGHEADTWGAGWFVAGSSGEIGPIIETFLGPIGDGHGVELFYNWQATPWLNVTPDLQVLAPSRENVDTALVLGVRAVMLL
ncbi:carbohydrate porin [Botrimarina mediterranea]|uniref:Carbohydrate-selective porin, OprB family n=1 Tax=Botrimarina mediterranea TaxID=2528022 RepID=A0A518K874_9BACT|nr:carbohydrate porin [Botrimarina mediterranea]QDV73994.1 Carbohydrate-selective porin, OprB family [Botrimarina mediterranea]QDV78624.1 Carbohydrate-selective porin, OprB family [Planctomycetes bacterium K2D]